MDTSSKNWSTNNNTTTWDSDGDKEDWGYQISSGDHGKDYTKNQILTSGNGNPITPRNPSLAYFNNMVYAAYKGGRTAGDSSDENMYIMTANSQHQWNDPVQLLSKETSKYAPALTVCNGYLVCVFFRDGHSDHPYYAVSTNGTDWSDVVKISSDRPDNDKATDPFVMALDNNTIALSYVTGGSAVVKVFDFMVS